MYYATLYVLNWIHMVRMNDKCRVEYKNVLARVRGLFSARSLYFSVNNWIHTFLLAIKQCNNEEFKATELP